jgi:hypothetical protein
MTGVVSIICTHKHHVRHGVSGISPVGHSDICYLSGIYLLSVIPDKGNRESILVAFRMNPPRTTCVDDGKG